MGRTKRILEDGICYHVISRCNNRERLLIDREDCRRFLSVCEHYRKKHTFLFHAFTIMPSHVHLIVTPQNGIYLNRIMHDILDVYSTYFNKKHGRIGHFWITPYRDRIISDDIYALTCLRYVHDNPKKAGLVMSPSQWEWSSHQFYSSGRMPKDITLTPLPSYLNLGKNSRQQKSAYRTIMEQYSNEDIEQKLFEGRMRMTSVRVRCYLSRLQRIFNMR